MPKVSQAVIIEKTSVLAKAKGVLTKVTYRFRNRQAIGRTTPGKSTTMAIRWLHFRMILIAEQSF